MNHKKLHKISKIIKREGKYYQFNYRGTHCELIRNTMNGWCGYVSFKINPQTILMHKLIGDDLLEDLCNQIHCHGGITYYSIKEDIIRLGFDCCHSGDLIPILIDVPRMTFFLPNEKYRTRHYASKECKSIIFQLEEIFSTTK